MLRDIAMAVRHMPGVVDGLCLHALHALGAGVVGGHAALVTLVCAAMSVRGWAALCHAVACIGLPKLLLAEQRADDGEEEGEREQDAAMEDSAELAAMPQSTWVWRACSNTKKIYDT